MIKILAAFALLALGLTQAPAHPTTANHDEPKVSKKALCSNWAAEVKAHKEPTYLQFVMAFQNGFMA